jgi:hypothetical protein
MVAGITIIELNPQRAVGSKRVVAVATSDDS